MADPESHVLKLRDVIMGRCAFPSPLSAGTSRAPFRPGLGWELVEPVFQLQQGAGPEAQARYRAARDALSLALYAPGGALVETARIDVFADEKSPTGLMLEAVVVGRQ